MRSGRIRDCSMDWICWEVSMRSVAGGEWMLARYAGEQRAGTIMGDLREQRDERGEWWFWRSFAGVLIAVAWRPALGFVVAFCVAGWAWNELMSRQIGMIVTPELTIATFTGVI